MPHIKGDPEQMFAFSDSLGAWCDLTREGILQMYSRLAEMERVDWDDENYRRFVERFQPIAASIMVNLTEFDSELVPHLRQLAQRYAELLNAGE